VSRLEFGFFLAGALFAFVCFTLGMIAAIGGDYAEAAFFVATSIAIDPSDRIRDRLGR
jgi:hypothetical protein